MTGKRWTKSQVDILTEKYSTTNDNELSLMLNVSHNSIGLKANRLGLKNIRYSNDGFSLDRKKQKVLHV